MLFFVTKFDAPHLEEIAKIDISKVISSVPLVLSSHIITCWCLNDELSDMEFYLVTQQEV